MTVLVTVQIVGAQARLRRYQSGGRSSCRCTHEGFYDPKTVSPPNVGAYLSRGAAQDCILPALFTASGRSA